MQSAVHINSPAVWSMCMASISDEVLLRRLRLCRADLLSSLQTGRLPPNSRSLREIADLQLAIMATEGVIADKSSPDFRREYHAEQAA